MAKQDTDTRYPYTYACDLIRSVSGHTEAGCGLSRSSASRIRELIAKAIGMPDEELAKKLADYYNEHEEQITNDCVQEFLITQEYYRSKEK